MIEGKCPKCGASYFGWALQFPRNQSCSHCGAALKIYKNGELISEGYSPFTAEKYSLNLPSDVKEKDTSVTNEVKDKRPHP
jgi:transcription initiation factor IIE alpha subunit